MKQKTIKEQDETKYPRKGLIKYWDKTYLEVYNIDKDNKHHPNHFKKYVVLKKNKNDNNNI